MRGGLVPPSRASGAQIPIQRDSDKMDRAPPEFHRSAADRPPFKPSRQVLRSGSCRQTVFADESPDVTEVRLSSSCPLNG